jgi:hypothetical protein
MRGENLKYLAISETKQNASTKRYTESCIALLYLVKISSSHPYPGFQLLSHSSDVACSYKPVASLISLSSDENNRTGKTNLILIASKIIVSVNKVRRWRWSSFRIFVSATLEPACSFAQGQLPHNETALHQMKKEATIFSEVNLSTRVGRRLAL